MPLHNERPRRGVTWPPMFGAGVNVSAAPARARRAAAVGLVASVIAVGCAYDRPAGRPENYDLRLAQGAPVPTVALSDDSLPVFAVLGGSLERQSDSVRITLRLRLPAPCAGRAPVGGATTGGDLRTVLTRALACDDAQAANWTRQYGVHDAAAGWTLAGIPVNSAGVPALDTAVSRRGADTLLVRMPAGNVAHPTWIALAFVRRAAAP